MRDQYRYEDGPTTCYPVAKVVRSIEKQIKANRALSRSDIRLATAMGLVSADTIRPLGYNDGLFYPIDFAAIRAPLRAAAAPATRVARASTQGTLHALALLVDFSDNKGHRSASDFDTLLFDANDPGSMTSYYREISKGSLTVTGEAIGYVRVPHPYSYYTDGQSGTGNNYPKNTPGLLVDALTEFCKNDNLKRFDVDGDGYVDGIFLIHAGGGAEAEPDPAKRPDMIWSHKWTLPQPFTNQGVKVFAYSTEPEDGHVGVFAHEFGHVLGLPDLYDTTYRSRGLGDWCLMGGGSWGNGGKNPSRMSAWCVAKLGWAKPKVVKKAATLTIPPMAGNTTDCYRLWTKGKPGPEYFLIENRQQSGMDTYLPGAGLAVWHIDESQSSNTNPLSYLVGLVQADGKRDLELNRNGGDPGDLFPGSKKVTSVTDTTTPSTRANGGAATGVALSGIKQQSADVVVRVRV